MTRVRRGNSTNSAKQTAYYEIWRLGRIVAAMTETARTTLYAVIGGALGGGIGAAIGSAADLPGAGPVGIGLTVGALAGFLLGLPRKRDE